MTDTSGVSSGSRLAFVLVHSPSVGPSTWAPVAEVLAGRGHTAVVPSLLDVGRAGPPFWPRIAELVGASTTECPPSSPIVLVVHSNAGLFVPAIVTTSPRAVTACVFVDAALPAHSGSTAVARPELLELLRDKAVDGVLPPWTDWWDEADVAPMFPDDATRAVVTAEQPRLPLSYYEQRIPVPDGWDEDHPCGYVLFSSAYDATAADARERGWVVDTVRGEHLHQIVDPRTVATSILSVVDQA